MAAIISSNEPHLSTMSIIEEATDLTNKLIEVNHAYGRKFLVMKADGTLSVNSTFVSSSITAEELYNRHIKSLITQLPESSHVYKDLIHQFKKYQQLVFKDKDSDLKLEASRGNESTESGTNGTIPSTERTPSSSSSSSSSPSITSSMSNKILDKDIMIDIRIAIYLAPILEYLNEPDNQMFLFKDRNIIHTTPDFSDFCNEANLYVCNLIERLFKHSEIPAAYEVAVYLSQEFKIYQKRLDEIMERTTSAEVILSPSFSSLSSSSTSSASSDRLEESFLTEDEIISPSTSSSSSSSPSSSSLSSPLMGASKETRKRSSAPEKRVAFAETVRDGPTKTISYQPISFAELNDDDSINIENLTKAYQKIMKEVLHDLRLPHNKEDKEKIRYYLKDNEKMGYYLAGAFQEALSMTTGEIENQNIKTEKQAAEYLFTLYKSQISRFYGEPAFQAMVAMREKPLFEPLTDDIIQAIHERVVGSPGAPQAFLSYFGKVIKERNSNTQVNSG